ncbi:hypothetical protein H4S14_003908 [Agrobacterium vitis]|nr:hypothetical protein [Agrobacterium vitis]MBE1440137.1 hypothetical protein [Agrobacterium vitis]
MTSINSFYRDPNAVAYATQLFSSAKAQASQSSTAANSFDTNATDGGSTSSQRALARIIEILSLGDSATADQASVSESIGYITGVSGTEGDDSLTFTGRAVYNVETGNGDDALIAKSAAIVGVALGEGADSLKASGSLIADIDGGADKDDIQLTGTLIMNVTGGAGDDSIKASGQSLVGVDGGDGNDTMYLEGSRIFASGGKGNDTVTIHQTGGQNAIAEYAFAAGDGQDTIATDGPLSIRLSGYNESDLTITSANNSLTIQMNGSDDKMTVSLDGTDNTNAAALNYAVVTENGHTVLKIS